jgi:uncharacterized YceG family protein
MSPEWPDDPLFDPDDPAAVEREERRREREAKRQQREAKRGKKDAPAPPPPKPAAPPAPPRTPEQEFWDEDPEPAPPVPGQEPPPAAATPAAPDPGMVERGRRRLLGRRRSKDPAPASSPKAPSVPPISAPAPAADAPPPKPSAPKVKARPPTLEAPAPAVPKDPASAPATTPPPDRDKPPVDPARVSEGGASPVPVPVPPGDAATPSEGDSLGKAALGGAAGAAAAGVAGGAAAAGSADAGATAGPSQPPTGEHQPMSDQPPTGEDPSPTGEHTASGDPAATSEQAVPGGDPSATGEHASPTGEHGPDSREFAPPPAPPEAPTTGDFQPLVRDWDFHDEGDPDMTGAAREGRRRGEDGGKRRGGPVGALLRHPFRILAAVVVILILLFLNSLFQPFGGDGSGRVQVRIPKGAGVGEVGDILEKRGVIDGSYLGLVDASTLFQMRVTLDGKRGDLIAGHHTMQKGMGYGDAITALTKEPSVKAKPGIVTVTVPEGYHRSETAKLVAEDGLKGSYLKATKKSKYLNPAQYGGKKAKNLEGFLFPDTWELKSGTPVKNLVQLQLEDFKKKIKKVNMKYANSKNLTIFDVVTIASMVEREAGVPKQRKLVASVIYNRLHEGMTLGSDATVRFATGNFTRPLTQSELESSSPYNTRIHAGLPPGPIGNPGLAAIKAAANPAKAGYLFFVTSPDCKKLAFSKTEAEFEKDVQRYEASSCGE